MKIVNKKNILLLVMVTMFTAISNAQISKAEIRATGLTCSMCSNAINKQLKTLPEVLNVETDLNTNTFVVTLKDNSFTPSIIKKKVEKAGFFIGSLILTVNSEVVKKSPYIIIKDTDSKPKQLQIQVLDKGYVTEKEFKKLSKSLKNVATYASNNEDDFHIKIIN